MEKLKGPIQFTFAKFDFSKNVWRCFNERFFQKEWIVSRSPTGDRIFKSYWVTKCL